jgi:hypothetical protein
MNKNRYDSHLNGLGDYAAPISCVICKSDMNYSAMQQVFDFDRNEYHLFNENLGEEKAEKLLEILEKNYE